MVTRKEFIGASAMFAAAGGALGADRDEDVEKVAVMRSSTPPRNRHPYQGIDWATAHQIRGTTHVHCKTQADLDEIAAQIKERDERDMNRPVAPLKQADDAVLVDTSDLTIEEVVEKILAIIDEKI